MRMWVIARSLLAGGVCVAWLGLATPASAATGDGGGQVFKVTVTTVETSSDGGSTYTTLFSGSQEIDIAATNAGAVAASLVSGVQLAPATYNRIRVTIGATMKAKGYVNIAGVTNYTDGGTDAGAFSQAVGNNNPPSSGFEESTFTIPSGNRTSIDTVSIVVTPTNAPTVRVAFNTAGVFINSGGNPSLGPPTVTITTN
ncbi:MAG: hypothetical protein HY599_01675 [Candidatus Omnitrophica bacterium]|nr:hypothetical protein [Candidatus Omnitrophota bacterium]